MMRGRKPKPTALKLLAGNPGKRALNTSEPSPQRALMYAPRFLDEVGKAEWRRMSHVLYDLGLLTRLDWAALAGYCDAYSTWYEARKILKKEGLTAVGAQGGMVRHPCILIRDRSLAIMKSFLVEFGMTPSSRSRVKATPQDEPSLAEVLFLMSRDGQD